MYVTTQNITFFFIKMYVKKKSRCIHFYCMFVELYRLNNTSWNMETFSTKADYFNPINASKKNNTKTLFEIRKTTYIFIIKMYIHFYSRRQRGIMLFVLQFGRGYYQGTVKCPLCTKQFIQVPNTFMK